MYPHKNNLKNKTENIPTLKIAQKLSLLHPPKYTITADIPIQHCANSFAFYDREGKENTLFRILSDITTLRNLFLHKLAYPSDSDI